MNGHYRWCGWCCNLRSPLCCECQLCQECCRCPPPPLPNYSALPPPMEPLPPMGPPPPPIRIIREQIILPVPYPVWPKTQRCSGGGDPYALCGPPPPPPHLLQRGWDPYALCGPPPPQPQYPPECAPYGQGQYAFQAPPQPQYPSKGGECAPPASYAPFQPPPQPQCPQNQSRRSPGCLEIVHGRPWPCTRRLYKNGQPITPGYKGHVPGLRFHAAGRTFGAATRDTCCIMSKWDQCCPILPCRIFEQ